VHGNHTQPSSKNREENYYRNEKKENDLIFPSQTNVIYNKYAVKEARAVQMVNQKKTPRFAAS
jgi:hypothetical protein